MPKIHICVKYDIQSFIYERSAVFSSVQYEVLKQIASGSQLTTRSNCEWQYGKKVAVIVAVGLAVSLLLTVAVRYCFFRLQLP